MTENSDVLVLGGAAAGLAGLGLPLTELRVDGHLLGTHLALDATGATGVPGVWAAGNVADPMAQVLTAAAAGQRAGAVINADLVAAEVRAARCEGATA